MSSLRHQLEDMRAAAPGAAVIAFFTALLTALATLMLVPRLLEPAHLVWAFPLIGLLQYHLVISGHEAVHRTLCRWPAANEAMGELGQALVGVDFHAYRQQHLEHHRATSTETDPDGHIYGPIVAARRGWRRVATWVLGTPLEVLTKLRQKGAPARDDTRRGAIVVVFTQLALVGLSWAATGWWWGYLAVWLGPLMVVAVFLNRTRILVEHGLAKQMAHAHPDIVWGSRIPTVDLVVPAWQRWLFAPFSFNYHCSHHLFMAVPHNKLAELHSVLQGRRHPGFVVARGDYFDALRAVLRA